MKATTMIGVCTGGFVLGCALALSGWGPLDPPAGPVLPTSKTLGEMQPRIPISAATTPGDGDSTFRIIQPGSYYLTGNVTGVNGQYGIKVMTSGVTVDLNGFTMEGGAGTLAGVRAGDTNLRSITIMNGTVRSWAGGGIDLSSLDARNCRVSGITATLNTGRGIAIGNQGVVSDCSSVQNTGNGFNVGTGGVISNCNASSNGGIGINTADGCTISGCATSFNVGGITAFNGCTIVNCTANNSSGTSSGINAAAGCVVSQCTAFSNTLHGINADTGSTVTQCVARLNSLDGIRVSSACTVLANTCSTNGNGGDGAGVHATLADNRIEGNTCTLADRGVDVDTAGNFISRNICSGNTNNWDVVASNVILVVLGAPAAAVNGNAGGIAPGSADPNANFTY